MILVLADKCSQAAKDAGHHCCVNTNLDHTHWMISEEKVDWMISEEKVELPRVRALRVIDVSCAVFMVDRNTVFQTKRTYLQYRKFAILLNYVSRQCIIVREIRGLWYFALLVLYLFSCVHATRVDTWRPEHDCRGPDCIRCGGEQPS